MSAHTVSDGGGSSGPSLVAGNPKKPPDKGRAQVDESRVDGAPDVQKTPAGAIRTLWTDAKRRVNALTSPTKKGAPGASADVQEARTTGRASEQPSPTKTPDNKRRKRDKDDVWSSAPMVPEVMMTDTASLQRSDGADDEDVFTARPVITPLPAPQAAAAAIEGDAAHGVEDMEEGEDFESIRTDRTALAEDIARVRERMTADTFTSEWVRKELALLVEHARQLRRNAAGDSRLGFDFDSQGATPELVSVAHTVPENAIDARLAKLETNFAKLFEAITKNALPLDISATPAPAPATSAAPTAPQDPNSYAARASATPPGAQQKATQSPSKPSQAQAKGGKSSPTRRYEETRAIFQLTSPLRHTERTERVKRVAIDTEVINDALLEHCGASMGPRVAGLNWSENGNLVLMAMDGFTGEHLVEHASVITAALGLTCEVRARRDVPWHKATLARVPTFGPDGHLLTDADVLANLRKTNPRFAALSLVDSLSPVHWLTSEQARRTQPTASMVACFSTPEDADAFLSLNNRIYVFGHTCGTRKFEERNADPMCTNCWAVKPKHRTVSCKSDPRCRLCAGNHHTDEHACGDCAAERATSNGDEQMEEATEASRVGPCAHIALKCVNCGDGHAANDARCPHRRKMVGSSAGAPPMSGIAQAKRPAKTSKCTPATGANATRPVERAAEVVPAEEDAWPTTLPYGEEEPARSTDKTQGSAVEVSATPQPTPSGSEGTASEDPKVLTIPMTAAAATPLTGQAKRQARIKLLKETFPSATDELWRSWVGAANGDVEEAIKKGLAHYGGSAKTLPGEKKIDILRTQWAALNTKTRPATNTTEPTMARKPSINNLLNPLSPHESA